jgi:hypothetical protein
MQTEEIVKVLESISTEQLQAVLKEREEYKKTEYGFEQAVRELQQTHAFAIDDFFAKVERYHSSKHKRPLDRDSFEKYADTYKKSVDEILEAYWLNMPASAVISLKVREFPLEDEKRELRSRADILDLKR